MRPSVTQTHQQLVKDPTSSESAPQVPTRLCSWKIAGVTNALCHLQTSIRTQASSCMSVWLDPDTKWGMDADLHRVGWSCSPDPPPPPALPMPEAPSGSCDVQGPRDPAEDH